MIKNSHLFVLINYGYERIRQWARRIDAADRNEEIDVPWRYRNYLKQPDEDAERKWAIAERIFLEMKQEADGNLLIVYIPPRVRVEVDGNGYQYMSSNSDSYDIDHPTHRLRDFAEVNDIYYLDLVEPFRKEYENKKDLYFEHDGHWSRSGHRLAGEELAKVLGEALDQEEKPAIPATAMP